MLAAAIGLGLTLSGTGWHPRAGARHHARVAPATARHDGVWYLAGLARTGYALAPGWAAGLVSRIEHALATGAAV
jgi:hypothetical protein